MFCSPYAKLFGAVFLVFALNKIKTPLDGSTALLLVLAVILLFDPFGLRRQRPAPPLHPWPRQFWPASTKLPEA
jgi:hypothetical protein